MKQLFFILLTFFISQLITAQNVYVGYAYFDENRVLRVSPSVNAKEVSNMQEKSATYFVKIKGQDNNDWFKAYDECGKFVGYVLESDVDHSRFTGQILYNIPIYNEKTGKWGIVDVNGKLIVPYTYYGCGYEDWCIYFSEGLAKVRLKEYDEDNTKCGFIDSRGKLVIPVIYDHYGTDHFSEDGTAKVCKNGIYGTLDKKGNVIIPIIYNNLEVSENKLIAASKGSKSGFLNSKGEIVIPFIYDETHIFKQINNDWIACVKKNGKYGYIDPMGHIIIPFIYDEIYDYYTNDTNPRLQATKDGKTGFIDLNGNVIIPFIYDDITCSVNENLITVKRDGKWGYINKAGKTIIPIVYDEALAFVYSNESYNEWLAPVKINGNWGLINQDGNLIIPFEYKELIYTGGTTQISVSNGNDNVFYIDLNDM